MKKTILMTLGLAAAVSVNAQNVNVSTEGNNTFKIPQEIYGQFAEHLGRCIYDGVWVGEKSTIANVNGYRKDVLEALKDLQIPVLRWPGGCFADTYNWRDGVGPKENRPAIKNVFWGGTMEDNSFGTAEFFNLCEMLGCKSYLSINVGSGTVRDMNEWLEYITGTQSCPMVDARKKDGREKPWKIDYMGIGNESWGCGGNMTAAYYSDLYRQYSGYALLYTNGTNPIRVACGANGDSPEWTNEVMKNCTWNTEAISLHYYTLPTNDWGKKGSDRDFAEDQYFSTLKNAVHINDVINHQLVEMDKFDKNHKVKLMVDEWGIWTDPEPGTIPGHLYQQNTMRDALVASSSFDIFNSHADRIGMANIAQMINVLQAMILTKGDKMVLTPTYHVFKMYAPHQNADYIPVNYVSPKYTLNGESIDAVNMTLSKKSNEFYLTISNKDCKNKQTITLDLSKLKASQIASAKILTSKKFNDFNSFEAPQTIKPADFKGASVKKGILTIELPAMSIVSISMK